MKKKTIVISFKKKNNRLYLLYEFDDSSVTTSDGYKREAFPPLAIHSYTLTSKIIYFNNRILKNICPSYYIIVEAWSVFVSLVLIALSRIHSVKLYLVLLFLPPLSEKNK